MFLQNSGIVSRAIYFLLPRCSISLVITIETKRGATIPRQFCHDILPQKDVVERIDRVDLQGVVLILRIARIDYDAVYTGAKGRRELEPFNRHRHQFAQGHISQTLEQSLRIFRHLRQNKINTLEES